MGRLFFALALHFASMKRHTRCSLMAILPAAALLAGCGTLQAYEGSRLPAGERAVVHADPSVSAGLPVEVILRKVDDLEVPVSRTSVELRPGPHRFIVDCRVREAGVVTRFVVDAEVAAGGSYRLVADATARGCRSVELQ
ncbi:MAG: hypothetical protein H6R27_1093 [Proteobacteria bacterium]|nr:hypothetical protein [Pseudomonadota bacterium]